MRTKTDIYNDMAAAIMTAYSTDHSRALSGAEWLQQLAAELVELIKSEQPQPLADAFDEQAGPGDGWRWLKPGEVSKNGDEYKHYDDWKAISALIGGTINNPKTFRRRIEKL